MDKNTISIIAELAKRMRIMIVDADNTMLAAYKDFLESFFVEVHCTEQSKDAYLLWRADTDRYDIIIMAMDDANASNLELFKRIRKKSYEQKVIIALASNDYNELRDIVSNGIEGVITGPADKTSLLTIFYRSLRDISDRKLLHSYITQLSIMAKDNADLRVRTRNQNVFIENMSEAENPDISSEEITKSTNSLVEKYAIRSSFKDDSMAKAIREIDVFSLEKIDVFREKIHTYYQQLIDLDIADAATSKSAIIVTSNGLLKMIEVINSLGLFPVTVQAALHMTTFLKELDPNVFEDEEKKHLIIDILTALFDDLDKWIETVFIKQDLEFVNYFDASFANTCLELEAAFTSESVNNDDDALEFF
ncbi:MAG: response regulator [Sulfuricurvum sp.]|nr:response regulator [Sulfuricurvum sp.]